MSQRNLLPSFLPSLLSQSDDEGAPTFSLEDAIKLILDEEPHKHASSKPHEDETSRQNQHYLVARVTIKNGKYYGMIKLLRYIASNVTDFFPIAPFLDKENIIFSVMNVEQADEIKHLCEHLFNRKKISVTNICENYSRKNIPSDEDLKKVMAQRFNERDRVLDLSNIKLEKGFPKNMLTSFSGIISMTEIIKTKYPQTRSVVLKENDLDNVKFVSSLPLICKNLKTVDVSHNNIKYVSQLQVLRLCAVDNLILRNNPFALSCFGLEEYGRKVHRYLPKIKNLDGSDVSTKKFYNPGTRLPMPSSNTTNLRAKRKRRISVITID